MKIKNKKNSQAGIALVFSIILSMIFLTITMGILNIATKEMNFSSSAKDSNNSFFAADSGVECALYNDKSGSIVFTATNTGKINCFGNVLALTSNLTDTLQVFNFNVSGLGSNSNSCAKVTVTKVYDGGTPSNLLSAQIISKGYNIGDSNCASTAINRTERVLEVNYK